MTNKKAEKLIEKYSMEKHAENGLFIECNEDKNISDSNKRPSSGFIYYYIAPGEKTEFHRIDCDEYWSYNAGSTVEIWVIDKEGKLNVKYCGIEKNSQPTILFKKGEIFASKVPKESEDGTFITCITIPRFSYDGFELFKKEEIITKYPEVEKFWKEYLL